MAGPARSQTDGGVPASRPATAYWGLAFVLLLLMSAGMVTVPGDDKDVPFIRDFYQDNRTVIVIAQVIGLAASVAFLAFARGLQRSDWVGRAPWVSACGSAVAAAAILTGVPPLLLSVLAGSASSGTISALATASDLVDVILFTAIAAFAASMTMAVDNTWLRALSVGVVVVSAVRAGLVLTGSEALELAGPMSFIALVLCLAIFSWRSERNSGP